MNATHHDDAKATDSAKDEARAREEARLDEALEATFPASDPISMAQPARRGDRSGLAPDGVRPKGR